MNKSAQEEKIGWVLIPPTILALENLTLTEKVVLGRINGLISSKGYCFASNDYLATGLGITPRTVRNVISSLMLKKFLKRSLQNDTQTGSTVRKLYITRHSHDRGEEKFSGGEEKFSGGGGKNFHIELSREFIKENIDKRKTESVSKLTKNTKASKSQSEYREWLETFNREFGTAFKTNALQGNFEHWRNSYSQREMLDAIPRIRDHEWLRDKVKPELILRQTDTHKNPVDRIGELLSTKPTRRFV